MLINCDRVHETSVGDQWCKNCFRKSILSSSNFASKTEFLLSKNRGFSLTFTVQYNCSKLRLRAIKQTSSYDFTHR